MISLSRIFDMRGSTFWGLFSYTLLLGLLGVVGIACMRELPPGNSDVISVILGAMTGSVLTIVTFRFGSSRGSEVKTGIIVQQGEAKGNAEAESKEEEAKS